MKKIITLMLLVSSSAFAKPEIAIQCFEDSATYLSSIILVTYDRDVEDKKWTITKIRAEKMLFSEKYSSESVFFSMKREGFEDQKFSFYLDLGEYGYASITGQGRKVAESLVDIQLKVKNSREINEIGQKYHCSAWSI